MPNTIFLTIKVFVFSLDFIAFWSDCDNICRNHACYKPRL